MNAIKNRKSTRVWQWLMACFIAAGFSLATISAQTLVLLERKANVTLKIPENPPQPRFIGLRAFGSVRTDPAYRFTDPVVITSPPGETNRLFVVEQRGRIQVITNLVSPTRTLFMDIDRRVSGGVPNNEQGLLGMAFHPGYATNRQFFVFYTSSSGSANRLSRFETSPDDPNQALPDSEMILINQRDDAGNHNGGDLHFGADGYLYVSLGDEGGGNDQYNNSQRLNRDFFSGILRIDVDKKPGNLPPNPHAASSNNYSIPADNPFVGATDFNGAIVDATDIRSEFWAVGLRNPWRMSFDRPTGRLYVGDVGQGAREEIDIITRGANYGWSYREGFIAGPRRRPPEAFTYADPIYDYPRRDGVSITGGVVYRGNRYPELFANYIFADYGSGNLWALRFDEAGAANVRRLSADTGITAFGIDPSNGDVLYADNGQDTIKRIVPREDTTPSTIPNLLSETGAFSDLETLTPNEGIVPYELNVPFWSDNAKKSRWFSIPELDRKIGFQRDDNWALPSGTVWIKHFELEMTKGVPASARRLETRFLVRNDDGIYGLTYRWNETQTDAELVSEEGFDESFVINDGGANRTQTWHYPSRTECLRCHTPESGFALGFKTEQLNRDFDYNGTHANQIRVLSDAGYFESPTENTHSLAALARPDDSDQSLEYRVRSYLATNCSQCHQPGGAGLGLFDTQLATSTESAGLVDGLLARGFENPGDRVVHPGSVDRSMLFKRIATLGNGRMPPLASSVLDESAIVLLSSWITEELAEYQGFSEWQTAHFGSITDPNAATMADPDNDGASNLLEHLTGTDPNAASETWKVSVQREGGVIQIRFPRISNRSFEVQASSDLSDPSSWSPVNDPANRPLFASRDSTAVIEDRIDQANARYYRVRVRAP